MVSITLKIGKLSRPDSLLKPRSPHSTSPFLHSRGAQASPHPQATAAASTDPGQPIPSGKFLCHQQAMHSCSSQRAAQFRSQPWALALRKALPLIDFMFCCHCVEILNNFGTKSLVFSFCPESACYVAILGSHTLLQKF